MNKVKCKSCDSDMPRARFELGYRVCTKCSKVEPYGHVHIVEGKTADTIQILPGKVAERANRYAQRTPSGVMKIMSENKY